MLLTAVASSHLIWSGGCPAPGGAEGFTELRAPWSGGSGAGILTVVLAPHSLSSGQRPSRISGKCPKPDPLSPLFCSVPLACSLGDPLLLLLALTYPVRGAV